MKGAVCLPAKIGVMRRLLIAVVMSIGLSLVVFASGSSVANAQAKNSPQQQDVAQPEVAPDVPDAIQVPAGEEVVLLAHATGSQIYTCQAATDGKFAWTLKGPDAELHDRKDKVIGQHSAGPSWKLKDGSEVTGKAVAKVDALDSSSVPWVLVKVVTHTGGGLLSRVDTIQRIRTHGGQPPADGCDAAHVNAETKSSYSADYYFYAPAK